MAWPFYLVMLVFAPTVLELLFGSGFAQGASALRILSATMLVATACGPIDVVLLMSGRSMLSLANLVIALILNIGLNLLLVPRIGISGAAIAWLAAILSTNLLPLAEVWMILRIQPWSRPWRLACGGVAVMVLGPCFVMLAVLGQGTAALLAGAAAAACCYVALLVWQRMPLHLQDLYGGLVRGRRRPGPATSSARVLNPVRRR